MGRQETEESQTTEKLNETDSIDAMSHISVSRIGSKKSQN